MPNSLVTLSSYCRARIGRCALVLLLAPGFALGAAPAGELKRSESLDMRRAGKVTDDERAVLRIEWRAGMSGVDQDRSLQEMLTKLRQMEKSADAVGQVFRSLPAEKRAAKPTPAPPPTTAAPVPPPTAVAPTTPPTAVAPTTPPTAAAPAPVSEEGPNWRLIAGNLMALALVGIWLSNRRKNQREAAALEAKLAAKAKEEAALKAGGPMPKFSDFPPPPIEPIELDDWTHAGDRVEPSVASLSPTSEISSPIASPLVPVEEVEQVSTAIAAADPMALPHPAVESATVTPSAEIDFVLEEADPATVVPETPPRARSLAETATATGEAEKKDLEPTLQLAEIMLSMGLEQGAAQTLVEYTEANPRDAIYHMLKLLGIYRKRGLHQEFQETAEKLRKNFNIQAEDWSASGSGEPPTLEKFSRVSQHVQSIWGQPGECISYLRHLIEDNRDGARAGFPQSVAEEILLLVEILKETSGADQGAA
jgi:hypothetical protein